MSIPATRTRSTPRLVVALLAAALAAGCGDETVEPAPATPTTITVSPASVTLQSLGDTVRMTATVKDQYGQTIPDMAVTWSSSDPAVGNVDVASGLVRAVANGSVTITATAWSVSGSAAVTVDQAAAEILLDRATDTISASVDTLRLSARAFDANGHAVPLAVFTWSSSDTLVATVSQEGLVTGVSAGQAEITAASGSATATALVTVTALAGQVVVSPPAATILWGDTLRLIAEAFDDKGRVIAGATFDWSSSDVSVLRVDGSGLVTGVGLGWATVTAEVDGTRGAAELTVESPDRAALVALYNATDGPNWMRRYNWLSDEVLGSWYGVEMDGYGRVRELALAGNGLSGSIPPELGDLARLEALDLYVNELAGSIPPQLGNLASLELLVLGGNQLSGPIPPELGKLVNLKRMYLGWNELSGSIPPELGDLASAELLHLAWNELSGSIPPELGNLPSVRLLRLGGNELSGPIPPELGNLASLHRLELAKNNLSGPVPGAFIGLEGIGVLQLANNEDMSGPLPAGLTDLPLTALAAGGTDLCAPRGHAFDEWLAGMLVPWIARCGDEAMVYLVQAVQSRTYKVPLVAGEEALLRIFVTAGKETTVGIPPVRARIYRNGVEQRVVDIPAKSTPIPTVVDEGELSKSVNFKIPGELVEPGLEMVIEVDPGGTLDEGLGVPERIPETGRLLVDVRKMPALDLTVIPFIWAEDPDEEVIEIAEEMEADPEGHSLLEDTRILLPVGEIEVTAHDPVTTNSNSISSLLSETEAIRVLEGGPGHYMAMMSGSVTGPGGTAFLRGRSSASRLFSSTIAHELGHNMSLLHASCGLPVDENPSFPDPGGRIGAWGYDLRAGRLVPPDRADLMSYCAPIWISGYGFSKAMNWRLRDEATSARGQTTTPTTSLLLWGGAEADGNPHLNPTFVVDAPAALPASAGAYTLTGHGAGGGELFSLSFAMPEVADGDGSSSFVFALPVQPGWEDALATITLSGPDGAVTLNGDTDRPMVILRNPVTGQVRGFLRDLPVEPQAAMDAAGRAVEPGLQVLFSRGIPDPGKWRR